MNKLFSVKTSRTRYIDWCNEFGAYECTNVWVDRFTYDEAVEIVKNLTKLHVYHAWIVNHDGFNEYYRFGEKAIPPKDGNTKPKPKTQTDVISMINFSL